MKRVDKTHCPINFALEVFGDSWSLLIVRDIVFWNKRTYGEFLHSDEGIATNVLAARLTHLVQKGILAKSVHPSDRRKEVYTLTERGLDLVPILLEISGWSSRYDTQSTAPQAFVDTVYANRDATFALVRGTVSDGGSIFVGPNSVVNKLRKLR